MRRRRELGRRKDLVALRVGATGYVVSIARVRELVRPQQTVPVAGAGPEVLGVADYRNEVLPVVDLRRLLEVADPDTFDSIWVVVDDALGPIALVVDVVVGVIAGDLEPAAEGHSTQVVRYDNQVFFPLDLEPALAQGTAVHAALGRSLGKR